MNRWRCSECSSCFWDGEILRAPSPFDLDDIVTGCPSCKSVQSFEGACEMDGCDRAASGGYPLPEGYTWRCWEHRPSPDQNPKGQDT